MLKEQKRIVILMCCSLTFSKIIENWNENPIEEEWILLNLDSDKCWNVYIDSILNKNDPRNPYGFDIVFTNCNDQGLFISILELVNEGEWFEGEDVYKSIEK